MEFHALANTAHSCYPWCHHI